MIQLWRIIVICPALTLWRLDTTELAALLNLDSSLGAFGTYYCALMFDQVASVFGRRHDLVLRAIRDLRAQLPEDRLLNFAETVEMRESPSGGAMIPSASYQISRDGFTLLAMGFTGKKALGFNSDSMECFAFLLLM